MSDFVVKNRFSAPVDWSAAYLTTNPVFQDLCAQFPLSQHTHWPDVAMLNTWRNDPLYTFVDNDLLAEDGRYYEEFIFANKQIPTRAENWHDLFGALIWILFPKTKALLNKMHMAEIAQHGQKQRSPLRNKLTLLDECGILVALEPAAFAHASLLREHQWQSSFWLQRAAWGQYIRPVVFGHAIYEMATQPFIGLTAKSWFMEVPAGFSKWPLTDVYTFLDEKLAEQIANTAALLDNQQLTPLPVLGIPGWYDENEQQLFYTNIDYFRPRRK